MIDPEIKTKFLEEVAQTGNIYISCRKVGIAKATIYRWNKEDKEFAKKLREVVKLGRENLCDLAEHSLLLLIKNQHFPAIKYALGHNSKRYKLKYDRKVVLEHRSPDREGKIKPVTLEDVIDGIKKDIGGQNSTPEDEKNDRS